MTTTLRSLLLLLFVTNISTAMMEDGLSTGQAMTFSDPVQDGLFSMPTGRGIARNQFYFSAVNGLFLKSGFAPTDFLHFNASYLFGVDNRPGRWSLGTTVHLLQSRKFLRGLSLGGYVGTLEGYHGMGYETHRRSVLSLVAALSLGDDNVQGHMGAARHFWLQKQDYPLFVTSYVQIGADFVLHRSESGGGLKLMGEFTIPQFADLPFAKTGSRYIFGIRYIGGKFMGDAGWIFRSSSSLAEDNSASAGPSLVLGFAL